MLKNKTKKQFTFSKSYPARTKWFQKNSENFKESSWKYKTSLDTTASKVKKIRK